MRLIYDTIKKAGLGDGEKMVARPMKGAAGKARAARSRSTPQPAKSCRTSISAASERNERIWSYVRIAHRPCRQAPTTTASRISVSRRHHEPLQIRIPQHPRRAAASSIRCSDLDGARRARRRRARSPPISASTARRPRSHVGIASSRSCCCTGCRRPATSRSR